MYLNHTFHTLSFKLYFSDIQSILINTGLGAMFNPVITTSKPKLLISLFSRVQVTTEVKVHDNIEFICSIVH